MLRPLIVILAACSTSFFLVVSSLGAPDDAEGSARVSQSAAAVATSNSMEVLDDTRKLIVGDVLSFRIVEDEDPITRVIVTDSGEVEIPYIGRVRAKDLTCKQVALKAKRLLEKDYYYKATVLLGLDYNTYGARHKRTANATQRHAAVNATTGYTLMGQVMRPGIYPLPDDEVFTVSHAILRSGGFEKFANEKRVRLLRKTDRSKEPKEYTIDLHEVMQRGRLKHDIPLHAGDVIIVDRKLINF